MVTNHSLLAVDMLAGRHIMPPHKVLVVDEAHDLTDRVTSAAQAELTADGLDRAARRTRSLVDADGQDRLVGAADALATALAGARPGRIESLPAPVRQACTLIDAASRDCLTQIGDIKADDPDPVRKQQARAALSTLADTAQRMLAESEQDVIWVDGGAGPSDSRQALVVAPLSVAGLLRGHLFDERTVIATSATLSLGGRFDTIARALGLNGKAGSDQPATGSRPTAKPANAKGGGGKKDGGKDGGKDTDAEPPAWTSLDVGSPFDYAKQGILYVAAHLPRPTQSGLSEPASAELVRLVGALGGRTLGLFSSRKAAGQAADALRAQTSLHVYLQGDEALPILVRKFRADPDSCLLGVMSLWQGVDVPGDACQLVVIDRLPFPRPDEPLSAARSAAVDAAGGSGFASVSVPVAAVRLAQGAGRLVRSATDRGVVAVLDPRLHTARSYGSYLRESLPPFWYTTRADVAYGALRRLRGPVDTKAGS